MSSQRGTSGARHLGVIEPKLSLPRVHAGMLARVRVLELLDRDPGTRLTVLAATVGYGKTTLLRSWCAERPEAVIWMTLDAADDDPVRLWTHLATAVERLGHGLGDRALASLGVRGAPLTLASQTRDFLLRTSVLGRFRPDLCDEVRGRRAAIETHARWAPRCGSDEHDRRANFAGEERGYADYRTGCASR